MKNAYIEHTPMRVARVAGVAYLIIIAAGIFAEFVVRSSLVVPDDPAATASNIAASESLFRFGIVSDLIMLLSDVVVTAALYVLLKPISRNLALLAAFARLVMASVLGFNLMNQVSALLLLNGTGFLSTAFDAEQLQALALLALTSHSIGYSVGLVFFGFGTTVIGYLLYQSRFLPKPLAALVSLAGLVYVFSSAAIILAPQYESAITPVFIVPFVAELMLALWLLIKAANFGRGVPVANAVPA